MNIPQSSRSIENVSGMFLADQELEQWLSNWIKSDSFTSQKTHESSSKDVQSLLHPSNAFQLSRRSWSPLQHSSDSSEDQAISDTPTKSRYHFFFIACLNPQESESLVCSFQNASRLSYSRAESERRLCPQQMMSGINVGENFVNLLRDTKDRRIFAIQCISQCEIEYRELDRCINSESAIVYEIHIMADSKQKVCTAFHRFAQIMKDLMPKTAFLSDIINSPASWDQLPVKRVNRKQLQNHRSRQYGELLLEEYDSVECAASYGEYVKSEKGEINSPDEEDSGSQNESGKTIFAERDKLKRTLNGKYNKVSSSSIPRLKKNTVPNRNSQISKKNTSRRRFLQSQSTPTMTTEVSVQASELDFPLRTDSSATSVDSEFWKKMLHIVERCVNSAISRRCTPLEISNNSSDYLSNTNMCQTPNEFCVGRNNSRTEIHPQDAVSLLDECSDTNLTSFEDLEENVYLEEFSCQCDRATQPRENYAKRLLEKQQGKGGYIPTVNGENETTPTSLGQNALHRNDSRKEVNKSIAKGDNTVAPNEYSQNELNIKESLRGIADRKSSVRISSTDRNSKTADGATKQPILKSYTKPTLEYPLLKGSVGAISFEVNIQTNEGLLIVPFNCRTKELFRHTVKGQLIGRRMLQACAECHFQVNNVSVLEMQKEGTHKASVFIRVNCQFEDTNVIDDVLQKVVDLVKT